MVGFTLNHSSVESLLDDLMPGGTYCFRDSAVRSLDLHDEPVSPAWMCGAAPRLNLHDGEVTLHIDKCRGRPLGHCCRFALIDTWGGSSMDPYPVVALRPLVTERQWVGGVDLENWLRARIGAVLAASDHQIYICHAAAGGQTSTDESLRKQVDDNLRTVFA